MPTVEGGSRLRAPGHRPVAPGASAVVCSVAPSATSTPRAALRAWRRGPRGPGAAVCSRPGLRAGEQAWELGLPPLCSLGTPQVSPHTWASCAPRNAALLSSMVRVGVCKLRRLRTCCARFQSRRFHACSWGHWPGREHAGGPADHQPCGPRAGWAPCTPAVPGWRRVQVPRGQAGRRGS